MGCVGCRVGGVCVGGGRVIKVKILKIQVVADTYCCFCSTLVLKDLIHY